MQGFDWKPSKVNLVAQRKILLRAKLWRLNWRINEPSQGNAVGNNPEDEIGESLQAVKY